MQSTDLVTGCLHLSKPALFVYKHNELILQDLFVGGVEGCGMICLFFFKERMGQETKKGWKRLMWWRPMVIARGVTHRGLRVETPALGMKLEGGRRDTRMLLCLKTRLFQCCFSRM